LVFDWYQNYVDATISVPEDSISCQLGINWDRYTEWDLVTLTQNYLKLLLKYLSDSNNGILIHCISGANGIYGFLLKFLDEKHFLMAIYYFCRLGSHTIIRFVDED